MTGGYLLYGARGSGAVAVEAALTLAGQPYELIEAYTFSERDDSGDRVLAANPMRQVPALVLPSRDGRGGEVMTESAAILIWLAEAHPAARLGPAPGGAGRAQFLRWMSFVSAAIYSLYWVKDEPARLAPDPAAQPVLVERTMDRIAECWGIMERQLAPTGPYLMGAELSVLDLYVAVVSRFRPRRARFYDVAPRMGEIIRRVDEDPRLAALWLDRMGPPLP